MTKSSKKHHPGHNERGAGRKPLPQGVAKSKRESCLFREHEYAAFLEVAEIRGLSRSNLLRAGLRLVGVQLGPDEIPRIPRD